MSSGLLTRGADATKVARCRDLDVELLLGELELDCKLAEEVREEVAEQEAEDEDEASEEDTGQVEAGRREDEQVGEEREEDEEDEEEKEEELREEAVKLIGFGGELCEEGRVTPRKCTRG